MQRSIGGRLQMRPSGPPKACFRFPVAFESPETWTAVAPYPYDSPVWTPTR